MKRYVREFAHATMLAEKYERKCPEIAEMNKTIKKILNWTKSGHITDFEAIEGIVKAKRECEEESIKREEDERRVSYDY